MYIFVYNWRYVVALVDRLKARAEYNVTLRKELHSLYGIIHPNNILLSCEGINVNWKGKEIF